MSDSVQQLAEAEHPPEVSIRGRRIRNPKLRRGIFLLPSLFTTGNLLCGYYASVATLTGSILQTDPFDHAAKAIGLAIVFDSLDGRVARLTGTNTEFGVQFDSLADVVSFGIAPALLAYSGACGIFRVWIARKVPSRSRNSAGGSASRLWFAARGAWRVLTCKAWLPGGRNILWVCPLQRRRE